MHGAVPTLLVLAQSQVRGHSQRARTNEHLFTVRCCDFVFVSLQNLCEASSCRCRSRRAISSAASDSQQSQRSQLQCAGARAEPSDRLHREVSFHFHGVGGEGSQEDCRHLRTQTSCTLATERDCSRRAQSVRDTDATSRRRTRRKARQSLRNEASKQAANLPPSASRGLRFARQHRLTIRSVNAFPRFSVERNATSSASSNAPTTCRNRLHAE